MFNWTHLFCFCVGVLISASYFWWCHRLDKQ